MPKNGFFDCFSKIFLRRTKFSQNAIIGAKECFVRARKINLVDLKKKKVRQNFRIFFENPPPLEKILDPPLFVSAIFSVSKSLWKDMRQAIFNYGVPIFRKFYCLFICRNESNGIFGIGVGFFQSNFDFSTSHFWQKIFVSFKKYCCPELKFEKIFHLQLLFVKLWGLKDCHFGRFGTINARYIIRFINA